MLVKIKNLCYTLKDEQNNYIFRWDYWSFFAAIDSTAPEFTTPAPFAFWWDRVR